MNNNANKHIGEQAKQLNIYVILSNTEKRSMLNWVY